MNSLVLITGLFALAAFAAGAWAIVERGRAARAEERLRLLEANAETLKAQAAQSAEQVAQTLVQRATESFQAQERVAQTRMEEKLRPVSETLARFQEHIAALEKARAEDAGGLKRQI